MHYQIQLGYFRIKQEDGDVKSSYQEEVLFSNTFRIPHMGTQMDIIFLGDWGVITE